MPDSWKYLLVPKKKKRERETIEDIRSRSPTVKGIYR